MAKISKSMSHSGSFSFCRIRKKLIILCFLTIVTSVNANAQLAPPSEYALKAVFLFNFAHFVEWPPTTFSDSGSSLVIGVLGEDPFGIYLDETVRDEKVNGIPLVVKRFKAVEEIQTCHELYISNSVVQDADRIVEHLKGKSILTVSDVEGFEEVGVMVKFAKEKNKLRLKIDVESAKNEELTISSKLLRLADIVKTQKD